MTFMRPRGVEMAADKYNGWTNYATWRVNLEFFEGSYEFYKEFDEELLRESLEDYLELECANPLTMSYALTFIADVNFHEIMEHINEAANDRSEHE